MQQNLQEGQGDPGKGGHILSNIPLISARVQQWARSFKAPPRRGPEPRVLGGGKQILGLR